MRASLVLATGALILTACSAPAPPPPALPFRVAPPTPVPEATRPPRRPPPPVPGENPYPYPTPTPPEVEPQEVAGMVLDRGDPAPGIELTVLSDRGRTFRTRTDAAGVFRVRELPPGAYYAHFYNDQVNERVGFWRTRNLTVSASAGAAFPAWDVHLVGMRNIPGQGASVAFPFRATFEPYPLAVSYRFRIHDRGGPGGEALYISPRVPARGITSFTFDGVANQGTGGMLGPGRYLWGYQWDAGMAGEGGCLFQDFVSGGRAATRSASSRL